MTDEASVLTDTVMNATYAARLTTLNNFQATNSCIETTRLLLLTLEKLGVERSRPQAVDVRAYNALAYASMEAGLAWEDWPERAWAMGTQAPRLVQDANPNGWAGHLVVILRGPNGRHLLDASADQFNRPGKLNIPGPVGSTVPELWTPLDPVTRVLNDGETFIEYAPIIGDRGSQWREFPAWVADPSWFEEAAALIAKQIQEGWVYTRGVEVTREHA